MSSLRAISLEHKTSAGDAIFKKGVTRSSLTAGLTRPACATDLALIVRSAVDLGAAGGLRLALLCDDSSAQDQGVTLVVRSSATLLIHTSFTGLTSCLAFSTVDGGHGISSTVGIFACCTGSKCDLRSCSAWSALILRSTNVGNTRYRDSLIVFNVDRS